MTRLKKNTLIAIWLIVATISFASMWARSDLVPSFPPSFATWLSNMYGAKNANDIEYLDGLCILAMAFIIVALGTALTLFIWQSFRKHKNPTS